MQAINKHIYLYIVYCGNYETLMEEQSCIWDFILHFGVDIHETLQAEEDTSFSRSSKNSLIVMQSDFFKRCIHL